MSHYRDTQVKVTKHTIIKLESQALSFLLMSQIYRLQIVLIKRIQSILVALMDKKVIASKSDGLLLKKYVLQTSPLPFTSLTPTLHLTI